MSQETIAAQDMITRFVQRQGREPASIAADTTYGNGEFLQWLLDRGITPYMRTRDSALRKNNPGYGPEWFIYLPESNSYPCPAGEQLNYVGLNARNRAHAYIGSAKRCGLCSPPASGPVVTRSTTFSSCGRDAKASAASSRQLASDSADIPEVMRRPIPVARSPAQASPTMRWRFNAEYGAVIRPARTDDARTRSSDGASERSGLLTRYDLREELPSNVLYCRNYQRPIKEIVLLLATGLGYEQAAVTGCPVKESSLVSTRRIVLRTNWVVGTKRSQI